MRVFRFTVILLLIGAPIPVAIGASLSLVQEYQGLAFDVSPDGTRVATLSESELCVHVIGRGIDGSTCFNLPHNEFLVQTANVMWSPDGSRIAFTGPEFGAAVWIVRPSAPAEEVRAAFEVQGYRNAPVALEGWIDRRHLFYRGVYSFGVGDLDTMSLAEPCGFTEADGHFSLLRGDARLLGSNRFGHVLQVQLASNGGGSPVLSCRTLRGTLARPARGNWLRFEDTLDANRLLFSEQQVEVVAEWRIGADLLAVDSTSLEYKERLYEGAPAAVSPDGQAIAALRRDSSNVVLVAYSTVGHAKLLDLPLSSREDPTSDREWEQIAPRWSKSSQHLLVWLGVPRTDAVVASLKDAAIVGTLPSFEGHPNYQWAAENRFVVERGDSIMVYEVVD